MIPVYFSEPAGQDLTEAVRWYERQRAGLGAEVLDAVSAAIDHLRRYPESASPRPSRPAVRQMFVSRFPYRLVYQIRNHEVRIVAVAHTSRHPDYWRHRLG